MNQNYDYHALGSYKKNIFDLLLKHELSDLLIDVLMPALEDSRFDKIDNFIGGNFKCMENGEKINVNLKQHLFDIPFIYTTITDERNAICIDTNISKSDKTLKEMNVLIYIVCHKDLLELDTKDKIKYKKMGYVGKSRIDIATAIVGDILNESRKFGIGTLSPTLYNSTSSYFPNNDFFGKILSFTCTDFMKDYMKNV